MLERNMTDPNPTEKEKIEDTRRQALRELTQFSEEHESDAPNPTINTIVEAWEKYTETNDDAWPTQKRWLAAQLESLLHSLLITGDGLIADEHDDCWNAAIKHYQEEIKRLIGPKE